MTCVQDACSQGGTWGGLREMLDMRPGKARNMFVCELSTRACPARATRLCRPPPAR